MAPDESTKRIRFGLCCLFRNEPIAFRRTTAKHLRTLSPDRRLHKLGEIVRHNAEALLLALTFCQTHGIGAFRINSQILPLKTHPEVGYAIEALPDHTDIVQAFRRCGRFSRKHRIRTSFHPDQFIVINSPDPGVIHRSVAELVYQAEVAQWVNADVINLHGGGGYGDKPHSLRRLALAVEKLPPAVRARLTLENDDRVYRPLDLLPVCRQTGVPLVYDVHHHRCLPDGLSVEEVTGQALATWNREPLFHLSSPLVPWGSGDQRPHSDFIDLGDFPCEWGSLDITVDLEAKAKELAVLQMIRELPDHLRQHCNKVTHDTALPQSD